MRTLVRGIRQRDRHEVQWNGRDDAGRPVTSGIYFYQLEARDFSATKKLIMLK